MLFNVIVWLEKLTIYKLDAHFGLKLICFFKDLMLIFCVCGNKLTLSYLADVKLNGQDLNLGHLIFISISKVSNCLLLR